MQRVIDADNSDIFDVLAYVAYALPPLTRVKRAADAREQVRVRYTDKQQAFIDFVLGQYAKEGVGELDGDKLAPLLKLRYKAIADATADLGDPAQIRGLFIGFQRYLYEASASQPAHDEQVVRATVSSLASETVLGSLLCLWPSPGHEVEAGALSRLEVVLRHGGNKIDP
jgi:hypothetical protein